MGKMHAVETPVTLFYQKLFFVTRLPEMHTTFDPLKANKLELVTSPFQLPIIMTWYNMIRLGHFKFFILIAKNVSEALHLTSQ